MAVNQKYSVLGGGGSLAAQLALNRTNAIREPQEVELTTQEPIKPGEVVKFQPTTGGGNQTIRATSKQPVVTKTPEVPQPPQEFATFDNELISGMDRGGMMDYLDQLNFQTQKGYTPTEQEQLNAMKISRMLAEPEQPEIVNQVQQELERVQALRNREAQRVQEQATEQFETQEDVIRGEFQRRRGQERQRGQEAIETQMRILGADAFSSRASKEVGKIQSVVNENSRILDQMETLEIQKAQAERQGASSDALNQYDELISGLRQASTEMNIAIAESINTMNAEASASYQEKLQNILTAGQQMPEMPLTQEEEMLANSFADLILDENGQVIVGMMDKVPPRMLSKVLTTAAKNKGARVEDVEPGKVVDGFQWNPETQRYDIPVGDGTQEEMTPLEQAKYDYQLLQNKELKNEIASQELEGVTDPIERATIIAAQRGNLDETTGDISIPRTQRGSQCGEFVNDSLGNRVFGDSFEQKKSKVNSVEPVVGGAVVMSTGNQYGHVGLVTGINMDTGTIEVLHSNYGSDGKVTTDTFDIYDSNIAGYYAPGTQETEDLPLESLSPIAQSVIAGGLKESQVKDNVPEDQVSEVLSEVQAYRRSQLEKGGVDQRTTDIIELTKGLRDLGRGKRIGAKLTDSDSLRGIVGGLTSLAKPKSVDAKSTFDLLQSTLALDNLVDLKGKGATFGALSDNELKFISDSASRLRLDMSSGEREKEIDRIVSMLEEGINRTQKKEQEAPTQYNAQENYGAGDMFTKDGKVWRVGEDGNAYEQ